MRQGEMLLSSLSSVLMQPEKWSDRKMILQRAPEMASVMVFLTTQKSAEVPFLTILLCNERNYQETLALT